MCVIVVREEEEGERGEDEGRAMKSQRKGDSLNEERELHVEWMPSCLSEHP